MNVVPTTSEMNLAAAKCCKTYKESVLKFRALEYANDRGTTEQAFDILEDHFINKQGLMDYCKNGFNENSPCGS